MSVQLSVLLALLASGAFAAELSWQQLDAVQNKLLGEDVLMGVDRWTQVHACAPCMPPVDTTATEESL